MNKTDQRRSGRILTNLKVMLCDEHFQYPGTVINCSDTGMSIHTAQYLPCEGTIEIKIPLKEECDVLNLSAKIRGIIKEDNVCDTLNVEILNPPPRYLTYLESLSSL